MIDAIAAPVTPEVSVNAGAPQQASGGSENGQFANTLNSAMKGKDAQQTTANQAAEKSATDGKPVETKADTKSEPDQDSANAESMAAVLIAQLLQQVPETVVTDANQAAGNVDAIGEQANAAQLPAVTQNNAQDADIDLAGLLAGLDRDTQAVTGQTGFNVQSQKNAQDASQIPVQQKIETAPAKQVQLAVEKVADNGSNAAGGDVATFRLMAQMDPSASVTGQAAVTVPQSGQSKASDGTNPANGVSVFSNVMGTQVSADTLIKAVDSSDKTSDDSNPSAGDDGSATFNLMGNTGAQTKTAEAGNAARADAVTKSYADLHTKIIDQVVQEVKLRKFDGGSDLMIRLTPPELGTLRIQISQQGGIMASQIHADNDTVRGLLQANLAQLTDALSNAGLKMDSISVHTEAPFSSFAQNMMSHSGAQQQQQANGNGRHRYSSRSGGTGVSGIGSAAASSMAATAAANAGYSWLA